MSASPSPIRTTRPTAAPSIPVAGPPSPPAPPPGADRGRDGTGTVVDPRIAQGLGRVVRPARGAPDRAGALVLRPATRTARSPSTPGWPARPNGVPWGDTLTGGLNTPLPMPPAPLTADETAIIPAPLTQLDLDPIVPESIARRNQAPSGGGGRPNDNPGAGDGDGFGLARFGEGGELIRASR